MVRINKQKITHLNVYKVAVESEEVQLSDDVKDKILRTRRVIEDFVRDKKVIYGVTTGFGAFKNTVISAEQVKELQKNLILSHAVGMGQPFNEAVVRAMMFLMASYLSKGHSGVRLEVIETLIKMLNKRVHPVVPEQGSVGSSGDLVPSAHLILVLIGEGEADFNGKRMSGRVAMKRAGIPLLKLEAKEGLALINNTTAMTANAALSLTEAEQLVDLADIAAALSAEALKATTQPYDAEVHKLRPYAGQILVAARMRKFLRGSLLINQQKLQDQYSLRCVPQIHGAVREAIAYVRKVVDTEVNAVTDNPLVFTYEGGTAKVISAGNFHGEPVSIAMDTLGIAIAELANSADRRVASILDPATNNGLPPFLAENGGLNSGLMITQYTTASLVSENKILAHPASVDSIPTSANVEDLVSMGTIAARKAWKIVENTKRVLTIELLVACQAIDFRLKNNLKLGTETNKIYTRIRKIVPFFPKDGLYYPYINSLMFSLDKIGII